MSQALLHGIYFYQLIDLSGQLWKATAVTIHTLQRSELEHRLPGSQCELVAEPGCAARPYIFKPQIPYLCLTPLHWKVPKTLLHVLYYLNVTSLLQENSY